MSKIHAMLDPRGYQKREVIELAKRPSLEELKTGKILFCNNTKLGFCNYYTVFDRIKEHLREIGCDDSKWVEYTETVRGKNAEKRKRQIKGRVDRCEKIVVERIEMFHHY